MNFDKLENPIEQFTRWYDEATHSQEAKPDAMTLATADKQGHSSARIVLFKGLYQEGFCFYTNYNSNKSQNLAENPHASIVFYWPVLGKQICIQGVVEKLPVSESEKYFHSRPRQSQIGAWSSKQSQTITSRTELENKFEDYQTKFKECEKIPLPTYWGGFVLKPTRVEFWHDRAHRLHDRFVYVRQESQWIIQQLAP